VDRARPGRRRERTHRLRGERLMIRPTPARSGLLGLVALVVACGTGCAGPQSHVAIDGKQVPLEVAFGKPTTIALKGNPPLSPVPSGVGVIPVQQQGGGSTVVVDDQPGKVVIPLTVKACPSADPLSAPK